MQNLSPSHNQPEFTVSQLSQALKRTVEDNFSYVRVRGEISGLKPAPSGHMYLSLKDEGAVMAAVCWKGVSSKFSFAPEDGLEVICTGRLTTYPGQSKYQLVIETMEPAGQGALMALLEKRKQQLAAEGLFAPERKKPLPLFPKVIGVVTSPTGAVIRDILHRLADRYPMPVVLWPVLVQGEQAARQIAEAIAGFNALPEGGAIPVPDVLIVARGGGSLEDLWPFNEEIVVRAAAASKIPLISAVGHETDTTLIDFTSSMRAPTPTAAAEMAVPVKRELQAFLAEAAYRMRQGIHRLCEEKRHRVEGMARGLTHPQKLLEQASFALDDYTVRLAGGLPRLVEIKTRQLAAVTAAMGTPDNMIAQHRSAVSWMGEKLQHCFTAELKQRRYLLDSTALRLRPEILLQAVAQHTERLSEYSERLDMAYQRLLEKHKERLNAAARLLQGLHYKRVLERGFALVRDADMAVVTRSGGMQERVRYHIEMADGIKPVEVVESDAPLPANKKAAGKKRGVRAEVKKEGPQGSLF